MNRDPFERLCDRLGNNIVGIAAIAAVCLVLWAMGALS